MSKFYILVSLSLLAALLSACSIPAIDPSLTAADVTESYIFDSGYDSTWEATLEALSKKHSLQSSDYDEAFAVTEFITLDPNDPGLADTDISTKNYSYSYALRLFLRGDTHTEINVDVALLPLYGQIVPQRVRRPELESYLRENLLNSICDHLSAKVGEHCNGFTSAVGWQLMAENKPEEEDFEEVAVVRDEQVVMVQTALKEQGYNPGRIDGIMGRKTSAALRSLQQNHSLQATGKLDASTLQLLGLESDPGGKNIRFAALAPSTVVKVRPVTHAKAVHASIGTVHLPTPGIVTQKTYLMSSANMMAETITEIPRGTILQLVEQRNSFFKTRYRGKRGYIYQGSIKTREELKSLK